MSDNALLEKIVEAIDNLGSTIEEAIERIPSELEEINSTLEDINSTLEDGKLEDISDSLVTVAEHFADKK